MTARVYKLSEEQRATAREGSARYKRTEKGQATVRRNSLNRLHYTPRAPGMTRERYNEMFAEQNGVCAMCATPPKGNKRLCADHNHRTGEIRGLLCVACNVLVGYAEHPMLAAAHEYLRQRST